MDLAQLLLVVVVTVLTLLLVFVGLQSLFILRDFRKSIKKFNNILEDAKSVSSSIAKPFSVSTNIFENFRQVKDIVDYVAKRPEETPAKKIFLSSKPHGRVFKRNGRPLTS